MSHSPLLCKKGLERRCLLTMLLVMRGEMFGTPNNLARNHYYLAWNLVIVIVGVDVDSSAAICG